MDLPHRLWIFSPLAVEDFSNGRGGQKIMRYVALLLCQQETFHDEDKTMLANWISLLPTYTSCHIIQSVVQEYLFD